MANLKADLVNELNNQKYYAEMELMRLAQTPDMVYKLKVGKIVEQLGTIATLNQQLALAEGYFQVPEQQAPAVAPAPDVPEAPVPEGNVEAPAPVAQAHQGQSHGE